MLHINADLLPPPHAFRLGRTVGGPSIMISTLAFSVNNHLLYKVQCFIRIMGTDKTDNLTCEIIYDNFTCENYRFSNNHQS